MPEMQKLIFVKSLIVIMLVSVISSCSIKLEPPAMPNDFTYEEIPIISEIFNSQSLDLKNSTKQNEFKLASDWQEITNALSLIKAIDGGTEYEKFYANLSPSNGKMFPAKNTPGDLIKNDNNLSEKDIIISKTPFLYTIKDKRILIYSSLPTSKGEPESQINLDYAPRDIFIAGDFLVAIGESNHKDSASISGFFSSVNIFDIKNKVNPLELFNLDVEGRIVDIGEINEKLVFLSKIENINDAEKRALLPKILNNGNEINCVKDTNCPLPKMHFLQSSHKSASYLTINHLSPNGPERNLNTETLLLPSDFNHILANDSLIISHQKLIDEELVAIQSLGKLLNDKISEASKKRIITINAIDNNILNQSEKINKVKSIYDFYLSSLADEDKGSFETSFSNEIKSGFEELYKEKNKTIVHKLIFDKNSLRPSNHVELDGIITNNTMQSFDESGFFLASAKFNLDNQSERLYQVFRLDNKLSIVGQSDVIKDNNVYSRISTQDQTLFLTNDSNPKFFHLLNVKKTSTPIDLGLISLPVNESGILITINGNSVLSIENGNPSAPNLKLTLYSISDPSNPFELDSFTFGASGTYSEATGNIKNSLNSQTKKILAMPIINNNINNQTFGNQEFNGLAVFNIDSSMIKLRGLIDHADMQKFDNQSGKISRIIYEGDNLLTLSASGIKINSIKGINQIKKIEF
jgi:hypothetical protein